MLAIGPYTHSSRVILAPMAGVTDRPFRTLCREFGAHWMVSEMLTSDSRLWHTRKSSLRLTHGDEPGPVWVQLAGADPSMMAEAARMNLALGADIIDINMGCPAKKVCNRAAGSALLRDEQLVADILAAVVAGADAPVTLKIRLGWSRDEMNACNIARIAEDAGISLLTVHGRTRACRFAGAVDYDMIARVKRNVAIPVIANGDIDSPQKARRVLEITGCDGVMTGRAAQGRPWLPAQIDHYLRTGDIPAAPGRQQLQDMLVRHVAALHGFYGEAQGLRIARKHVGWALDQMQGAAALKQAFNRAETVGMQFRLLESLSNLRLAA